ncbi:MAG: hypothetical protein WD716_10675 [Fimbriimonadaceae bacterium]
MPTKQALIDSIDFKEVKVTDLQFSFNGQTYTLPAALGVCIRGNTAYVTCDIKEKDVYTLTESGTIHRHHGPVSQAMWDALVKPPEEVVHAKKLATRIDVPKGYEWAIVEGSPQLVLSERRQKLIKKKRSLDTSKYPLGTKVTFMEGTPGKTKPGDTGKIVGYEGNQLVIEYEKRGKVLAQPGSRHRVGSTD